MRGRFLLCYHLRVSVFFTVHCYIFLDYVLSFIYILFRFRSRFLRSYKGQNITRVMIRGFQNERCHLCVSIVRFHNLSFRVLNHKAHFLPQNTLSSPFSVIGEKRKTCECMTIVGGEDSWVIKPLFPLSQFPLLTSLLMVQDGRSGKVTLLVVYYSAS